VNLAAAVVYRYNSRLMNHIENDAQLQRAAEKVPTAPRPRRWVGVVLWILAAVLMAGSAVYQRLTGPTHPKRGSFTVAGETYRHKLIRSATSGLPARVEIPDPGASVSGMLHWKRYKTADDYADVPLTPHDGKLVGELPSQPMAGKLEYYLLLSDGASQVQVPADRTVVLRFKGAVPAWALASHVVFIFFAVLWGIRTLLEALLNRPGMRWMAWTTLGLMLLGGMILGPVVQHHAFGAAWTGVPFGWDLTDNKTLIMFLCWLVAALALGWRSVKICPLWRWITVAAAVVMIVVYLIPHSMYGSELDYSKLDQGVDPVEAIGQG